MVRKLLMLSLLVGFGAATFAQTSTTSVRGIVTDPTGAVLTGGSVTRTDTKTLEMVTHPLGKNGEYSFYDVKPSTYQVKATVAGFNTLEQTTELLVSQPATVNFKLTVGAETQSVDVTANSVQSGAVAWRFGLRYTPPDYVHRVLRAAVR